MMRFFITIAMIVMLLLTACQNQAPSTIKVKLYNSSGDEAGTAELKEESEGVQINLKVEGLKPGFHGIHVHEYPKCEGSNFKSAGNHLNPENKAHGPMNPKGAHLGDMPNIKADDEGKAKGKLMVTGATLEEGKKSLLAKEGTSLIITADKDDGISQPTGSSGRRLICGKITSKTGK